MKKVLVSLVLVGILAVPVITSAAWYDWIFGTGGGGGGGLTGAEKELQSVYICCGPGTVLNRIINWLFAILLVIAAIAIIVAAYFFVTAAGDPDKTKTARNFVLYALIGVLVGFMAKGLIALVERIATGM